MKLNNKFLDSLIKKSSDELLKLSKDIQGIEFPEPNIIEFETTKLNNKYIAEILKNIPSGYAKSLKDTNFIYIVSLKCRSSKIKKNIFQGLCA